MDLLHSGRFDGFCLVSSDSDFTRLASRLREEGADVYGFGAHKTPESFRQACRRFIYTENLLPEAPAESAGEGRREACPAGERGGPDPQQGHLADGDGGWLGRTGRARPRLANMASDFDPRTYGYRKLSDLVRGSGAFEIDEREGGAMRIRPKAAGEREQDAHPGERANLAELPAERGHFARCFRRRHGLEATTKEGQLDWETAENSEACVATAQDARLWTQLLARYRQPSTGRSLVEIGVTLLPLVALWVLAWARARRRLLAGAAARDGCRGLPGAAVHDPARLQPRLLLPPSPGQRLARPRARRADPDAVRPVAAHPRHAPRLHRQSRPSRHRRHRHTHGRGISARVPCGTGCATGCIGTRWSCSASAPPICSSCSIACRSA